MERIVWMDSGLSYAPTWLDEKTIIDRAQEWNGQVVTVGQVIWEGPDRILLGLSKDEESGNWAGAFLIWKQAIIERTTLCEQTNALSVVS